MFNIYLSNKMVEIERLDKYYKYTNPINHKIFACCYWGNHRTDKYELEDLKEICKNRDELVEIFNIKSYYRKPIPKRKIKEVVVLEQRDIFGNILDTCYGRDHIEYYLTKEKQILAVFSMYVKDDDNQTLDLIKSKGYKEFKPIYWKDQKTFIKLIYK